MKATYRVLHLDCQSCALMMEGICEDTPGVQKAEVKIRQRLLEVEHDQTVTDETLQKNLAEAGYPVEKVS